MKSSSRVIVRTAAIAGCAAAALAAAGTSGAASGHDLAVGSAVNQFPTPAGPGFARLSVSAHSDADGSRPFGHVRAHGTTGAPSGDFKVSGPVTCLRVDGNRAAIKYRFAHATGSAAPFKGGGVEVFVEDNGPPQGGHSVDANAAQPPEAAGVFDLTATQCDDPNTATYDGVTSGDYVVRDR
jgi:hypothetical protein